jgi:hypothetical protein
VVQRIQWDAERAELTHVWADEFTVHVLIVGQLVKIVPFCLDAEDLATLKLLGARSASPPPTAPSPSKACAVPGSTVIEVGRAVDANAVADLAEHRVNASAELARCRVTLRLDRYLIHVISGGAEVSRTPYRATARHPVDSQDPSPKARPRPGFPEPVNDLVSRNCQGSPETTHHSGCGGSQ